MRRILIGSLVFVALVGCQQGAKEPTGSSSTGSDAERIQGEWVFDSVTDDGKSLPESQMAEVRTAKAVITADKFTIKQPGRSEIEQAYRIDSSKKPKEIDITETRRMMKQTGATEVQYVNKGIYVLDGDTLTICSPKDEDPRPAEIGSKAGSGVTLVVFKRAK
jgi:uncharacterized protein (TIGR03067 family)